MTAIRYTIPNANVTIDRHADGTSTISVEAARPTIPPVKFGQSITVSQELISGPIARGIMSTTEAMHRALNAPRFTPRVGDKVIGHGVTTGRDRIGYVVEVKPSHLYIAQVGARDPYGKYDPADIYLVRHDRNLRLVEAKPAKPKAGDVLTADQIRGVPWKRGTVLRQPGPGGDAYLLTEDGDWLGPLSLPKPFRFSFSDFGTNSATYDVVHVGK